MTQIATGTGGTTQAGGPARRRDHRDGTIRLDWQKSSRCGHPSRCGRGGVPALQPLLLGSLLSAHRIDPASLGYAATAEAAGVVLATVAASAWLPPRRLQMITVLAILTVLLANMLTITMAPSLCCM